MSKSHHHLIDRHFGSGRSAGDKIADVVVARLGSWSFIIWQSVVLVIWVFLNIFLLRHIGTKAFDPYPFILLNLGFSAQASYASPLILMAQNRQADRDRDFSQHQFEIIEAIRDSLTTGDSGGGGIL